MASELGASESEMTQTTCSNALVQPWADGKILETVEAHGTCGVRCDSSPCVAMILGSYKFELEFRFYNSFTGRLKILINLSKVQLASPYNEHNDD